ncbi:MAG: right-handed parallel beta-helix repeat-containing protein, partial [Candidatus Latescibacteria bacterium]|nr:right-handed parallel beta-helix repeat-containing protein [Candidatus Latescibacterota bacterium]
MSSVREFGAIGDGLHDDTEAVIQTLEHGDGHLLFPRGDYLLTRTVTLDLQRYGRAGIEGEGGTARVLMAGPGPAFHLLGTHEGTADPGSFGPEVWARERMPSVMNLEVEGRHPDADGFRVEGTMQSTFEGVLLRGLRHGIHIVGRARNVLVSHCHIYHNSGVGVFMDDLNLHQIIVAGSHISYCRRGGIKAIGSQIRNIQITGNDIE